MIEKRINQHGNLGVFALEIIPQGTVIIYKWNEDFYKEMEGWVHLTVAEVLMLPDWQQDLFYRYGLDEDFDKIAGPLDITYVTTTDNYINHACDPNLHFDSQGNVITSRKIEKDEELFIDYGCFTVNFDENFQCCCGSERCRGRVTKNDWIDLAFKYGYNMPKFLHQHIKGVLNGRKDF
ncbi:MAG: SET domain-containing protein [Blastocatellia bacterium]|nr:SET domain-containing protein [Blastocatellia bacterium]